MKNNQTTLPAASPLTLALAGIFSLGLGCGVSQAAVINVSSSEDDNGAASCTLRQAVASLNAAVLQAGCTNSGGVFGVNDTINLNPMSGNIILTSEAGGQLDIAEGKSISINGASGRNITIDGGGENQVFSVRNSTLNLDSLTITGGVGRNGGGVTATIESRVSLNNTTVSGNSALDGGGIYVSRNSSVTLNNSTVSGNSAGQLGGGIAVVSDSSASLNNSTVSGNSAGRTVGGGISVIYSSSISLSNCTVFGNSSPRTGGGIDVSYNSSGSLSNTIIVGNRSGDVFSEIGALFGSDITSYGGNLFGDNSTNNADAVGNFLNSNFTLIASDITATSDGTQPTVLSSILSPLADNGGPTQTHSLPANSPALNNAIMENCPSSDQRGRQRDDSTFYVIKAANQKLAAFELGGDNKCDIGSFER